MLNELRDPATALMVIFAAAVAVWAVLGFPGTAL